MYFYVHTDFLIIVPESTLFTHSYVADCQKILAEGWKKTLHHMQRQQTDLSLFPSGLSSPLMYILHQQGKQLRPLLTLLSFGLFKKDVKEALMPAIAMEFFHNFTLIHDDVMDRAPLRRNQPTVHTKWDTNIAILTGDALLIHGYRLLENLSARELPSVMRIFNRCGLQICEGQKQDLELENKDEKEVKEASYMEMIRLKTGCLLGSCLALGAVLAHTTEKTLQILQEIGEKTGMIFQLKDDVLDLYGKKNTFGKQVGGDILAKKKTFLLIKAMQRGSDSQKESLRKWLHSPTATPEEKIRHVKQLYDALEVKEAAEEQIAQLQQTCQHLVHSLEDTETNILQAQKPSFAEFLAHLSHRIQ